jgi:hypothetical protein
MKTRHLLPLFFIAFLSGLLHAQGDLTPPPGAPGPVMKSLDQIESRTAIPPSPATPVAGPHFTISQPGSYYLSGNIEVASGDGIVINSNNVTLDLNGFALISKAASPSGNAIHVINSGSSIAIKNGRIAGATERTEIGPRPWDATFAGAGWQGGILATSATGLDLSDLSVERCASFGIFLMQGRSVLEQITATGNGGIAIYANESSIAHCIANQNASTGIYATSGSITRFTSNYNGGFGIVVSGGSVTNSTASSNNSGGIYAYGGSGADCSAGASGFIGIQADQGTVADSIASYNGSDGIMAPGANVTGSRATGNFKRGIHVGFGVAVHCSASENSTDPATIDKNIDVAAGGQRIGCVPESE